MYNVTGLTFAPAILEQLLKFAKDRFGTYSDRLRYIQLGSAPLSEKAKETLKEMFPNTKLFNIYGATESGCTVSLEFSKYGRCKCKTCNIIHIKKFKEIFNKLNSVC